MTELVKFTDILVIINLKQINNSSDLTPNEFYSTSTKTLNDLTTHELLHL